MIERVFTPEIAKAIDVELSMALGEIVALFTIKETPKGAAPDNIRQKWIGVHLPIRDSLFNKFGLRDVTFDQLSQLYIENDVRVPVAAFDAVLALDDKDPAAAQWWMDSGFVRNRVHDTFGFRSNEGRIGMLEGPSSWLPSGESYEAEF